MKLHWSVKRGGIIVKTYKEHLLTSMYLYLPFSSRWYPCARKIPYALHPVSQKFPQRCLWNGSNLSLIDDGPLSSVQGRSSSAFSFHASLLQAIDGVMSLALCPQVVSQASQHFRSSEKASCLWGLLFPQVCLSAGSFIVRTLMRGETASRRIGCLFRSCDVFRALINSLRLLNLMKWICLFTFRLDWLVCCVSVKHQQTKQKSYWITLLKHQFHNQQEFN